MHRETGLSKHLSKMDLDNMKILYDYTAFVMQSRGGVSRVLYELFRHVLLHKDIECRLFAGFHKNKYLRNAPAEVRKYIVGWYLPEWMVKQSIFMPINRVLFKFFARTYRPDICHYTYFDTPTVPQNCKVVITMHDMIHEIFPEMFAANDPQHEKKKNAILRADGVICVSQNTKIDLIQHIGTTGKQIGVIYHGNSIEAMKFEASNCSYPYFLYVGTRDNEYKNFNIILEALSICKACSDVHLICFGGSRFSENELRRMDKLGLSKRVHHAGGSDAQLAGHYAGARALIYPSKYEGFGLPPIEAMSMGCPVMSSNAPPLPEIIGKAGVFFEPTDAQQLCDCMLKLEQTELRNKFISSGLNKANDYTWVRAADEAKSFYWTLM